MVLPVLAVECLDSNVFWNRFQASNINIVAIGIRPRDIEGLDTAGPAKIVLRYARIECVGRERIFSAQETKRCSRDY